MDCPAFIVGDAGVGEPPDNATDTADTVTDEVADAVGVGEEPAVTPVSVIITLSVSEPTVVVFPLNVQTLESVQIVMYGPEPAS
jgi:hypothetical protein